MNTECKVMVMYLYTSHSLRLVICAHAGNI